MATRTIRRRLEAADAARAQKAARAEPLTFADLPSANDEAAARAAAAGGGMQVVIEATGLRTAENVLAVIDPAILERARQNDAAPPPHRT